MVPFQPEERTNIADVFAQTIAVIEQGDWKSLHSGELHDLAQEMRDPITISCAGARTAMACTCLAKGQPGLIETFGRGEDPIDPEMMRPFLYHIVAAIYPVDPWSVRSWEEPAARIGLFNCLRILIWHTKEIAKTERALLEAFGPESSARVSALFVTSAPSKGGKTEDRLLNACLHHSREIWVACAPAFGRIPAARLPFAWMSLQRMVLSSSLREPVSEAFMRASTILAQFYR